MTQEEKKIQEQKDIINEMQEELSDIENDDGFINEEKLEKEIEPEASSIEEELIEEVNKEDEKIKDVLARTMADFENFKKRVERDRDDMIFFLKSDIFKKILPRIDDLERIIKNTPEDEQKGILFEGIISLYTKFKKDLDSFGVKSFESIGEEVDPDKHDVMTTIPGKQKGIIVDEFEKGYNLGDRILRHAKVVVGSGEE